jgi:hypothetical protein
MSKWLVPAAIALVTFGVSAGISWWLQVHGAPAAEAEHAEGAAAPAAHGQPPATAGTPSAGTSSAGTATPGELPVAVRPKPVSVEEILRLGDNLRQREQTLRDRSRDLDKERARMKLGWRMSAVNNRSWSPCKHASKA